jgi:hypothetical protein
MSEPTHGNMSKYMHFQKKRVKDLIIVNYFLTSHLDFIQKYA